MGIAAFCISDSRSFQMLIAFFSLPHFTLPEVPVNSYRHSSLGLMGLALVLGGCSDSNPTGNNAPVGTAVGAAQVAEMGSAAIEGADETLSSMLETVSDGGFGMSFEGGACPTVTVDTVVTPPSIVKTLQFGAVPETGPFPPTADDPCLRGWEHGGQVYLFGKLVATRTGDRSSEFSRSEELSDVGFIASPVPDFSTFWRGQRDGSRSFSRDAAGKLLATEDLTTTRKRKTATEEFGNSVTSQLEWSFTPVEGAQLQEDHARPSGTIVVTGNWHFVGQVRVEHRGEHRADGSSTPTELVDVDVTHAVKTNQPLEYDATCMGPARRRIKAGQLEFTRTRGDASRSFTLTWTACGVEPTKAEVGGTT